MTRLSIRKCLCAAALSILTATGASAQVINLPAPVRTGGMPLMEAIAHRQSAHEYVNKPLDRQTIADLLWVAYGFNRADKRVVPSAMNSQEFTVYALLPDGAYRYEAKDNTLTLVAAGEHKDLLANKQQPYVNDVPLHLVFVGDKAKARGMRDIPLMDVGYISQNVYLYCASKGLGTVARASFDKAGLAKLLGLTESQEVILVQAVGPVK